jgi:hypothetical protein
MTTNTKEIAVFMLEAADRQRAIRRKIDNPFGYFTNDYNEFIENSEIKNKRNQILQKSV